MKQSITINGPLKKELDNDRLIPYDPGYETERTIKTTNPYSGQSTMLTPEEYKLYIMIKQAEYNEDYDIVRKGLSKFSRMNANAYMTLLD